MNGWDFGIRIVEILGVVWGIKLFDYYNERRKERKKDADLSRNNLDQDYHRNDVVTALLEEIKFELKCDRVIEKAFSNGDVTFSGTHMKKISILNETDDENPMAPHFQLIPVRQFKRNLDFLRYAKDDYAVFTEYNKLDDLGALNGKYHRLTCLSVKIKDEKGRWIGILTASWDKPYVPTKEEIAYFKMMASRVSAIKP